LKEIHLVKRVSKELGMTYKELGEKIGYSESNLRSSVSQNKLSVQLKTSIELYLKVLKLEKNEEGRREIEDILRIYLNNLEDKKIK
jgi:ribosome-binding protein aMBF1 (putative translation factor)